MSIAFHLRARAVRERSPDVPQRESRPRRTPWVPAPAAHRLARTCPARRYRPCRAHRVGAIVKSGPWPSASVTPPAIACPIPSRNASRRSRRVDQFEPQRGFVGLPGTRLVQQYRIDARRRERPQEIRDARRRRIGGILVDLAVRRTACRRKRPSRPVARRRQRECEDRIGQRRAQRARQRAACSRSVLARQVFSGRCARFVFATIASCNAVSRVSHAAASSANGKVSTSDPSNPCAWRAHATHAALSSQGVLPPASNGTL